MLCWCWHALVFGITCWFFF